VRIEASLSSGWCYCPPILDGNGNSVKTGDAIATEVKLCPKEVSGEMRTEHVSHCFSNFNVGISPS